MNSTWNMVWHIFKKDVKLLWHFVLAAAGLHFISAGLLYAIDHGDVGQPLRNVSLLLQICSLSASALLIVIVVHQDAVPGVRQDWLVRPVRRGDLLLAKFLFVLLMVHGAIFAADLAEGLTNGFPFTQSFAAAGSRGVYLLLGLSIPMLAFASLTRNLSEAVIGGLAAFLGFAMLQILVNNRGQIGWLRGTGLFWIAESTMFAVALVGSTIILLLQFFRRKTVPARWAMAVVALLFQLAYLVPWNVAFALERRLSPNPGAGSSIALSFQPDQSKFRLPEGLTRATVYGRPGISREEASTVYLPVLVEGLPEGAVLNGDHAEVFLFSNNGRILHRGKVDNLSIRKEASAEPMHFTIGMRRNNFIRDIGPEDGYGDHDGKMVVYEGIPLPHYLYQEVKNQTIRLEIEYSFTLLQGTTYTTPALGGDLRVPHIGRCRTQMDQEADDIQIRCIQAGATQPCGSAFLENPSSGRRNPVRFSCWPNYSPYSGQYSPDAMDRFGASLRFRDSSGLTKYPVDLSQIREARVVLRFYQPQDHFTRRLVIPQIRLSDWESLEHQPPGDRP